MTTLRHTLPGLHQVGRAQYGLARPGARAGTLGAMQSREFGDRSSVFATYPASVRISSSDRDTALFTRRMVRL
jgi:hypothetical protein